MWNRIKYVLGAYASPLDTLFGQAARGQRAATQALLQGAQFPSGSGEDGYQIWVKASTFFI